MNVLSAITNHLPKSINRTGLIIKKYSPELLTGVGILCTTASTIFACKATTKIDGILNDHKYKKDSINALEELGGEEVDTENGDTEFIQYSKEDARKDRIILKCQTGKNIVKEYAPAIGMSVLGITCILGGHHIIKKRNIAIAAAYSLVNNKLTEYRERVVDDQGEDKDREYFYGLKNETIKVKEKDDEGKIKTVKKTVSYVDPNSISKYARFFDEGSRDWVDDPELNLAFLLSQQNYANDKLHSRGHLFLNEVYDMLEIPRTKEGAVVGWVVSEDSDNFVDFGIFSPYNNHSKEAHDFVNGYEKSILLDFNVDGVIYDLI